LGHSRPSHFVPVLNNVRYASDSDHSRDESELTLWANNGHSRVRLSPKEKPRDIARGFLKLIDQAAIAR
jgi:hypothetical protein